MYLPKPQTSKKLLANFSFRDLKLPSPKSPTRTASPIVLARTTRRCLLIRQRTGRMRVGHLEEKDPCDGFGGRTLVVSSAVALFVLFVIYCTSWDGNAAPVTVTTIGADTAAFTGVNTRVQDKARIQYQSRTTAENPLGDEGNTPEQ